jgi:hypothetical protein
MIQIAALASGIALAPASAFAVTLSSNDGYGNQHWTSHGDQSFAGTGQLESTSGNAVYLRGVVVYNNYPDYTCDRISSNTKSASLVTRSGSCSQVVAIPPSADAAGWKICHDKAFVPDGCGSQKNESF